MEKLYNLYHYQWESILPSQEERFTAYRERKSIAGKLNVCKQQDTADDDGLRNTLALDKLKQP